MRKILFLLLLISFSSVGVYAQAKRQVFILHSYSQEYTWTKSQHQNFIFAFDNTFPSVNFAAEYLDTKRVKMDGVYENFMLRYLQEKYKGYRPDIIYVTDDDALTFFMHHRSELFPQVPIVFSGVNNLNLQGRLDSEKFTGVYETKDILPNIDLIHQLSPQTRDIWIVGDASTTYQSIEEEIRRKIKDFTKYRFHFLSGERISDIVDHLPRRQKTFVILTTIGKWTDERGDNMAIKNSIATLLKLPNIVLLSMEDAYVGSGAVGGFVSSAKEQGSGAAGLAIRYLRGEPFRDIRSLDKSPNIYMFDRNALIRSRLILSEYTARNATMLYPEKSFFDLYQNILINVLFVLFLLLLIFSVFAFFLFREKNRQIEFHKHDCTEFRTLSAKLKNLFETVENSFHLGYWQWELGDGSVVCSDGLGKILQTDTGDVRDIDTMMLSIYPADKSLLHTMIKEVMETCSVRKFHHKIVAQDGNVESVVHRISPITNEEGEIKTLIGLVQKLDL
ncbi:MAG: diguanylate cyclase [Sulfuricurvum sp.]|jgi:ABC-type uncharacterized transport system substrate-binding protein|uniref:ABC transporter substrate-binding protein n=1 Tax=Sulfuricurvum sp. TaxID=2025608 RepID=UPI0025D605D9|nr:ABC transporter substrate binding protein [Sulfuricurvum sp.]MCK9373710.1 diguanylate cyclase [Sulfuricurvum sp.]